MIEYNNRKKADRLAEYITGNELRRYLAAKVEQYCGKAPSVFDGAAGSGQLEQFIKPSAFTAVEIQPESCAALAQNYPYAVVHNMSFFDFSDGLPHDCAVMNPPFSLKFKDLSSSEQIAILRDFPWKKSGVVDDVFVLKSLQYSRRYGFFILFPGVAYRNTERMFRGILGNSVAELNVVRNAFDDTPIEVLLLVVDKKKTASDVYQEIYCCKSAAVVYSQTGGAIGGDVWEIPREPAPEAEAVDIDEINRQLDEMALCHLKNHLEKQLLVIEFFNATIDYLGFIGRVERLCREYASRYRAYLC